MKKLELLLSCFIVTGNITSLFGGENIVNEPQERSKKWYAVVNKLSFPCFHALLEGAKWFSAAKNIDRDIALSLTSRWRGGITSMHEAAELGDIYRLKTLISLGFNLDSRTADGFTPLHLAVKGPKFHLGHVACVNALLDAGADLEVLDDDRQTPFFLATKGANIHGMEVLIKRGANILAQDKDGYTPLLQAIRSNQLASCKIILGSEKNPGLTTANYEGYTPLILAAEMGNVVICACLLRAKSPVGLTMQHGTTALHKAVSGGHAEICDLLLKYHANCRQKDDSGITPFDLAEKSGKDAIEAAFRDNLCVLCFENQSRIKAPCCSATICDDCWMAWDLQGAGCLNCRMTKAERIKKKKEKLMLDDAVILADGLLKSEIDEDSDSDESEILED